MLLALAEEKAVFGDAFSAGLNKDTLIQAIKDVKGSKKVTTRKYIKNEIFMHHSDHYFE